MPLLREAGRVVSENACVARALLPAFLGTRLKHEVSEKVLRLGPEYHEGHPSREILLFPLSVEITSFCSRDSPHLVLPSPVKQASAAMCVQPNALGRKAIQYIVLYCLTPARFRRYSSLNLCPPYPAWDGIGMSMHRFGRRRNLPGKQLLPRDSFVGRDPTFRKGREKWGTRHQLTTGR